MKQIKSVDAVISFLDINCSRPYPVYTDPQACKFIGDNTTKPGRVRHLDIMTHMARCYISLGEVELMWCCTEEELADIFTKVPANLQLKTIDWHIASTTTEYFLRYLSDFYILKRSSSERQTYSILNQKLLVWRN
jgi:hypothetical protein